mgnify:CR=1 FL=1|tara:strand:+ start:66 stop:197 length:132 start_codon:yes stop_codon:yes gene_type:complete
MIDTVLLAGIKRLLDSDMKAGKKVKRIRALIIRWTFASTSNEL